MLTFSKYCVWYLLMHVLFDTDASNFYVDFWSEANLPVQGMWVYTLATTLLVTADGLDYFIGRDCKTGIDCYSPGVKQYIKWGQILGACFLGVGSVIYCRWSR